MEITAREVLKNIADANAENNEKTRKALSDLNDAFCEAIGIDRLVKWMVKKLDGK